MKEIITIRHPKEEDSENGYCRICGWSIHGNNIGNKCRYHTRTKGHTVDIYRESWTEVTCKNKADRVNKPPDHPINRVDKRKTEAK